MCSWRIYATSKRNRRKRYPPTPGPTRPRRWRNSTPLTLGVDPFVAPEKTRHGRVLEPVPRDRIPEGLSAGDRMRRKLWTKRGRERYALRMETVEPVFGQIKQGRGFRQFLLRGLAKVNREWLLICAGHNLLKLFRFGAGMSGKVRGRDATGNNKESCRAIGSGIFKRQSACARPHQARTVAAG